MNVENPILKARQRLLANWLQAIDEADAEREDRFLAAKRFLDCELRRMHAFGGRVEPGRRGVF